MTADPETIRPLRADAERNRERILDAARALFASEGPDAAIDAIARRAGVGAGTVHRHFPAKQGLFAAIVVERLEQRTAEGQELAASGSPEGLFTLLERLLDDGQENQAVKAALADSGFDLRAAAPNTVERLNAALERLVNVGQRAGAVRSDVDVHDVKAVLIGALAAQEHAAGEADRLLRVRQLALDGMRTPRLW